jgi:hypothetical protein
MMAKIAFDKSYIGLACDHSGSMRGLAKKAADDLNGLILAIADAGRNHDIDSVVSVVKFGVIPKTQGYFGTRSGCERFVTLSSVNALRRVEDYEAEGSTPLFDAVGMLIEQFEKLPDANDKGVAFMITALTDGEENSSSSWNATSLMHKITKLQATGKWSFLFRVPRGYEGRLSREFHIPPGNIQVWDQTPEGFAKSTTETAAGFERYYGGFKTGTYATESFFTDLTKVTTADAERHLDEISTKVIIWEADIDGEMIQPFCERKTRKPYMKGHAYYELGKREKVQLNKKVLIEHLHSGKVYTGPEARKMVGLDGASGTASVKPGSHGEWRVYVQSTSINRKLPLNTHVAYWDGF